MRIVEFSLRRPKEQKKNYQHDLFFFFVHHSFRYKSSKNFELTSKRKKKDKTYILEVFLASSLLRNHDFARELIYNEIITKN